MNGKILKISSNDLYGNVDERQVVVFACFLHKKYMNKYIIFTFKDEYDKRRLYCGSVHMKEKSLVVFSVRENVLKYIDEFTESYLESRLDSNEYEILDIGNYSKIELVSYNNQECDKLLELDRLSIKKRLDNEEENDNDKKPVFLYILLVVLILLLIGVTYLYLNPDEFLVEYKKLECSSNLYNDRLLMDYVSDREILFDDKDKIKKIQVIDSYVFDNNIEYDEFKNSKKEEEYFDIVGGYKYVDSELKLKIIYEDETIIEDYDEIYEYMKKEGYSCIEGTYYE